MELDQIIKELNSLSLALERQESKQLTDCRMARRSFDLTRTLRDGVATAILGLQMTQQRMQKIVQEQAPIE